MIVAERAYYMYRRRLGSTLVSSLIAMTVVAMCLVVVLQAYLHGSRFVAGQTRRAQASAACRQQIETARAGGYANLPAVGRHPFPVGDVPEPSGQLTVAEGPFAGSRIVTAQVTWPAGERTSAGNVELTTVITARGISP